MSLLMDKSKSKKGASVSSVENIAVIDNFNLNIFPFKVVRDPCQKITLLLLKSKSVRVIVPESCF